MMRARSISLLLAGGLAQGLLSAPASAHEETREQVQRLLLDRSLRTQVVDVVALDAHGVSVLSPSGDMIVYPFDDVVALAPVGAWHDHVNDPTLGARGALTTRAGTVLLSDGQRLTGAPTGIDTDDETLAWSNAKLGGVRIALEMIERVTLPRILPTDEIPDQLSAELDDVVLLSNGDRLTGFIESIGMQTRIETEGGQVLEIEPTSIDQIALANDPSAASGVMVWLSDGSVVSLEDFETAELGEQVAVLGTLTPGAIESPSGERTPSEADDGLNALQMDFALDAVVAASFSANALLPLSRLQHTDEGARVEIEPAGIAALGARDMLLPRPMRATWTLPELTRRVAFTATLPIESRAWGDLNLIVQLDGNVIEERPMNAGAPVAEFAIEAQGAGELSIEVEEGRFGPIQDRVVISRGLVLLAE